MFGMAKKKGGPTLADILEMLRQQRGPQQGAMQPLPDRLPPWMLGNSGAPIDPNAMRGGPSMLPPGMTLEELIRRRGSDPRLIQTLPSRLGR